MNLSMIQYVEINSIGIVMLLIMLFYAVSMNEYEGEGQELFIKLLICNIVILLADICIYLFNSYNSRATMIANHASCMIYFIMHPYFGYLWLRYCIKRLYPERRQSWRLKILLNIPVFVMIAFVVTSPWTNMVYYITEQNVYMRGSNMSEITVISYLYWLVSAVLTIREMLLQKRIREKESYLTLLIFPLPTVIGNILQLKFYGLSIVWIFSAFSLLTLFINIKNYQLSRDILTGLFNRRQTDKHLRMEIKNIVNGNYLLFAVMLDVDSFKSINDRFGHVAGDRILVDLSDILRESCRERDFVARFGGDEFIIIGHVQDRTEVDAMISNIENTLALYNSSEHKGYQLSISAGYEIYSKTDCLTTDTIISSADNEMYKIKKTKG